MLLKTLKQTDVKNKTVLYRAPYDIETVIINNEYKIKDTSRIDATKDTLEYLINQNCKIVILTWVGRPQSTYKEQLSTKPHAKYLSNMLKLPIKYVNDCKGEQVIHKIAEMKNKDILMLENVRFYKEELENNPTFAKQLAQGYDIVVFDGFPQAHREAASTTGILTNLPSCAGFYFEKEYNSLNTLVNNPQKPFTLIIGGSKTSDKVDAINNLYNLADIILVGGGAANAFLKAEGKDMGLSYIEDEKSIQTASQILNRQPQNENYKQFRIENEIDLKKVMLPYDLYLGMDKNDNMSELTVTENSASPVPLDRMALDIGPITQMVYKEIILQSKTVFWAGPMGVYENPLFTKGTLSIAQAVSYTKAQTIVAGGDTIDALNQLGKPSQIDHISLAGGATLEFIAGKNLPVLDYLTQKTQ